MIFLFSWNAKSVFTVIYFVLSLNYSKFLLFAQKNVQYSILCQITSCSVEFRHFFFRDWIWRSEEGGGGRERYGGSALLDHCKPQNLISSGVYILMIRWKYHLLNSSLIPCVRKFGNSICKFQSGNFRNFGNLNLGIEFTCKQIKE